jgi:uncharacterized membrane protein
MFIEFTYKFNMWNKDNVVISKLHYKSIFFIYSSIFINLIINKVYCNMDNYKKMAIINVKYDFTYKIHL